MAIRRFNYTKRKRIAQVDARITLIERKNTTAEFEANLNLSRYGLPPRARVFVEAYRQTTWMRFDYGTVAHLQIPSDRNLSEFDTADAVLFRLRIVSSEHSNLGLLLAEADAIRPRRPEDSDNERIPLLPVRPGDLDREVCRIVIDDNDGAVLVINSEIAEWKSVCREPIFFSLIYSSALRQVLTRIVVEEKYHDPDSFDDWRTAWLRYALSLPGVSEEVPDSAEDREGAYEWIEGVVTSFSRRSDLLQRFLTYWTKEGAET